MLDGLYLQHYGIKGQQWGERRFQNEDGTLTEEGKKRYGVGLESATNFFEKTKSELSKFSGPSSERQKILDKMYFAKQNLKNEKIKEQLRKETNISEHRKNLIASYKKQGMTDDEAAIEAYNKEKSEKLRNTLLIAGAITVAAIGSYALYKHHKVAGNRFLRSGTTIQNISNSKVKDLNKPFYASYDKKDKDKYLGLFGGGHLGGKDVNALPVYKMDAVVEKNIKLAGSSRSRKVLNDMIKTDPDARQKIATAVQASKHNGIPMALYKKLDDPDKIAERVLSGKSLNKHEYQLFNHLLPYHNANQQPATDKFFTALKQKGFQGVIDENDKFFSGYQAKNPFILFDSKNLGAAKTTKLSNMFLSHKYYEAYNTVMRESVKQIIKEKTTKRAKSFITRFGLAAIAPTVGYFGVKRVSNARLQNLIKNYKTEHPNTKLSDNEILKNIYKVS